MNGGGNRRINIFQFTQIKRVVIVIIQPPVMSNPVTPWTAAHKASLSPTISLSLPKFMSIASVMPSSHLILWCPLLLLPLVFPCIRDFSNELAGFYQSLWIWAKVWREGKALTNAGDQRVLFYFRRPHVKGCVSDQENKILKSCSAHQQFWPLVFFSENSRG